MTPTRSELYSPENVVNMISAVRGLIQGSAQIYNKYDNEPGPESIASQERDSFPNRELIKDVHYRGVLSMEAAADHLMVFADSLTEPAKTVAPWTCVRGLLESSALATWFLDPTIDARERVGRCFAFRYSGFTQQIKFLRADGATAEIEMVQQRIQKVEQDAISLGYPRLLNENGNIKAIAMPMPNITELIGMTLNREGEYRLLSGVAHGHHWAVSQVGFRVSEENIGGQLVKIIKKHLHPEVVLFATDIAVSAFATVLWRLWRLYGWEEEEIKNLLDKIYDQMHYKTEIRFWHDT